MKATETAGSNRLIHEKSPYLRQHAENPVDWFAWGEAAFDKAAKEDKPMLVSIGYATCHWCHVMAEESFSDPETARVMNENLVNVKIDREERPDLDQIYITAVSALTGSAGWPLNVFLTPEGKPFYGGTYFPPRQRGGMPSWTEVVRAIGRAWQNPEERQKLLDSAGNVTAVLKQHLHDAQAGTAEPGLDETTLEKALDAFSGSYDPVRGGIGKAPKFPMPPVLRFLLFYSRYSRYRSGQTEKGRKALDMALHTLREMAKGGIFDHIGGGFHRYSTDDNWHVPHFEKMLYDNAQLIEVYLEAFEITGEERFARTARQCLEYVRRDMTHPRGGFYSAEDADSRVLDLAGPEDAGQGESKAEGAFYVWRKAELEHVLDARAAEMMAYHYGVKAQGNAETDPFGEFAGKNILFEARSIEDTARYFGQSPEETVSALQSARERLLEARNQRPRPHLDDKILTEWNALMISALARANRVLEDPSYLAEAEKGIEFIRQHLFSEDGRLYRRWREGQRAIPAMAGDSAFLVQALLDTYDASLDPGYLKEAIDLGGQMLDQFYDPDHGGFFMTAADQDRFLLFRSRDFTDGVVPAAGSVAALNCLRLYRLTGRDRFYDAARRTFDAAAARIRKNPAMAPQLLVALGSDLLGSAEIVIIGRKGEPGTQSLLHRVRKYPRESVQAVVVENASDRRQLAELMPHVEGMKGFEQGAAAYVCFNRACRDAVGDADALDKLMQEAVNTQ